MEAIKYYGKVLSDGHLSLPKGKTFLKGKTFEVILLPINEKDAFYNYTEELAVQKGFNHYSQKDIERIIHKSRNVKS